MVCPRCSSRLVVSSRYVKKECQACKHTWEVLPPPAPTALPTRPPPSSATTANRSPPAAASDQALRTADH
jgi:hypothetical protein